MIRLASCVKMRSQYTLTFHDMLIYMLLCGRVINIAKMLFSLCDLCFSSYLSVYGKSVGRSNRTDLFPQVEVIHWVQRDICFNVTEIKSGGCTLQHYAR